MSQWLTWNVTFRLHEWAKGHDTYRFLGEMEAADRMPPMDLENIRRRKLQGLINYAYAHVPYFRRLMREAGITPSAIRTPEDLRLLPIMRKQDVRENRHALRSDIARNLASFTTGGSTGEPLIFDLGKGRVASRVACRQRVSRWWGLSVGHAELVLWGAPTELTRQDRIRNLRDRLLDTRLLSAFEMNEPTMSRYLDILEAGRYRQMFGYPSAIYLICLHARKQNRNLRRLGIQVVFVTGEMLYPYQRELISETLACPVANGYGGRDSGFIAHECPQGGMHVLADAIILEIVDRHGYPVPSGECGEIVITDLYSHEAPFIRYATGDMATLSSRNCTCGRALPVLETIQGRANDLIVAPDGRAVNSLAFIYAVREIEGIEHFRVCQKAPNYFHVWIMRNQNFPEDAEERIRTAWAQLLRTSISVFFEYPRELPIDRSGKFRHVTSEVCVDDRSSPRSLSC